MSEEESGLTIIPKIAPPQKGIKLLDIFVRERAYIGDPVIVKVVSGGKSLAGALLSLISLDTLKVVQKGKTDRKGIVKFSAPKVYRPTVFIVDVKKKGYVYYWTKKDWRTQFQGTGFYPIATLAVYPLLMQAPTKLLLKNGPAKFEIDVAFGWTTWFRKPSFGALIEKARNLGYAANEDWWAGRGTISGHLGEKGSNDVWIWFGHSYITDDNTSTAEGITGWQLGAVVRGYDPISPEDLCEYMQDGNSVGIVFLGGCSTTSILQELVDCCVKLAIGFTDTVSATVMATALIKFWEALLDGDTLDEATQATNDFLTNAGESARLEWRAKPWLNPGGMTLDEIRNTSE